MAAERTPSLAILYPGDRAMRERADPGESRFGAGSATDERYVLCEINASSVAPFPEPAIGPLVQAASAEAGRIGTC